MKIIVDKIEEYPRHALSRADVQLIMSAVPAAWTENVKVIRLSASRSAGSVALYARFGETLTIASRGLTKATALHLMLRELAAHALGFKRRTFQHLQDRYESRVETLIAPFMKELSPQLSRRITLVKVDLEPTESFGELEPRAELATHTT